MIYLIFSILCSASLMMAFKLFERYKIDTFQAIVFNYLTAFLIAVPLTEGVTSIGSFWQAGWFPFAIFLGGLFISLFFLIGVTTQKSGITVASVSMKLSFVMPTLIAFMFYGESASWMKILGIVFAFAAVILTSIKKEEGEKKMGVLMILFPLIIFLGSGVCDAIVQHTKHSFFSTGGEEVFLIFLFATAFVLGFIALMIGVIRGKKKLHGKHILAGVLLGIPNYGSIYFLYKAISATGWDDSVVFPVNNLSIVAVSALLAYLVFKEKISALNLVGLILALSAIVLMTYGG